MQMWLALLLIGSGGVFLLMKRRRRHVATPRALHLQSSLTLGGKNRVVLLNAHGHEILLAVSEKGIQTLGRWPLDNEHRPQMDEAAGSYGEEAETAPALDMEDPLDARRQSPAIAGLLRLRKGSGGSQDYARASATDRAWENELRSSLERTEVQ